MVQLIILLLLNNFNAAEGQNSLQHTNDGINIEFYDCVHLEPLAYCRRPREPIDLTRDNDTNECEQNNGQPHTFSELRSKNISVNILVEYWRSTLEQIEEYSLFIKDQTEKDGSICQCHQPEAFGKSCEYQLPEGETIEETLKWQFTMRNKNEKEVQIYGDVICYETLECDSGVLCLDWRDICDGNQNCLGGRDEENCDLLEMNRCDLEEEYRCENGMCIPQEFFLDGDLDCLDWSDEIPFKNDQECPQESVNTECDDHICLLDHWSCGDGQCITDRLRFQKVAMYTTCHSLRDQYFMCESHVKDMQWTMPNGRCFRGERYEPLTVTNRNDDEEECEFLLKCVLSQGGETNCSCYKDSQCVEELDRVCPLSEIRYPRGAVGTPFTFFLFNRTRDWRDHRPNFILINGTVRCRDVLVTVIEKRIPFDINWSERGILEEHFCRPFLSNLSSSAILSTSHSCHHENGSTDVCQEWNQCLSRTRLRDGLRNCLSGRDELEQSETEMEKNCLRVRRHRFRCSREEPSCLSVIKFGDEYADCRNRFDELWFGMGRMTSSVRCNNDRQDECSLLRQYIEQSSTSTPKNDLRRRFGLPFRFHCDTFSDLPSRADENLLECQQSWICPTGRRRCQTGQCLGQRWAGDGEWDCSDAADEQSLLDFITDEILQVASKYTFTNQSFFVPSSCPEHSDPFLCLSSRSVQQGFQCFNFSQLGDGNIDCLGAQDERLTLPHCSQSSSILGHHFLCASTNSCIPFYLHCWRDEYRCPNRSDDELWCDREWRPSDCFDLVDFVCFDGRCLKGSRCNGMFECPFSEDEYMCDYQSSGNRYLVPHREFKQFSQGRVSSILHLFRYPSDMIISHPQPQSASPSMVPLSSPLSPYWCNRGVGVVSTQNHSTILCLCPPQYYGEKCQFHSDRVSIVLYVDLSESIPIDRRILLQLVVVLLFNNDVLSRDQFYLHPSVEFDSLLKKKKKTKLISHFVFPRSSTFLDHRRERFFNRSSLLSRSPFSIRIELYQTSLDERPSIIALWKYPLDFSHLPVSRLSRVLHFDRSSPHSCSSNPCPRNEQCHQLMNNKSEFICLCRENCSREDQQCLEGFCSKGSLCQPNSRSLLQEDSSSPFCLCPLNRYGRRCSIEYYACLSHPCQNNGSCFPDSRLDRVICLCRKEYFGPRCEMKRSSIHISLSTDLPYRGVVLQVLQIDLSSFEFILLQQQAFLQVPPNMEYYHQDQSLITGIVLAKVYSSSEISLPELYLLSIYEKIFSIVARTNLSSMNQCEHRRTFSFSSGDSSPILHHQICIDDPTRLCFRDDVYLCICAENHTRVECFLYDDDSDRCELCRANGRCLQGNPGQSNDFVCLCPACHSGRHCQFNTKSFSFTLDQLFSPDLLSHQRQTTTISLLIFFPLFTFLLAIPNNLFSLITLRRRSCLRHGVGHYLLWMSVINQLSLTLLVARLLHLTLNSTSRFRLSSMTNDLLCKSSNYLLSSSTRMVYWLTSLISIERLYTTLFLRGQWLKKPHIARRLIAFTFVAVFISDLYELFFYKSFSTTTDEESQGSMCVLDISSGDRFLWMTFHLLFLILHSLLPFLINLFSTITICLIIINKKINTSKKTDPTDQVSQSVWMKMRARLRLIVDVLRENKEFVLGPAITLVPQLFSLPLFISSFVFDCQNLEDSWLRHFLIVSYWISFTPQWTSFFLYILPSSLYSNEWRQTKLVRWINALLNRRASK